MNYKIVKSGLINKQIKLYCGDQAYMVESKSKLCDTCFVIEYSPDNVSEYCIHCGMKNSKLSVNNQQYTYVVNKKENQFITENHVFSIKKVGKKHFIFQNEIEVAKYIEVNSIKGKYEIEVLKNKDSELIRDIFILYFLILETDAVNATII